MRLQNFVSCVMLSVCSFTFAFSQDVEMQMAEAYALLNSNQSIDEILEFLEKIESDCVVHGNYDLSEVQNYLAQLAVAGTIQKTNKDVNDLAESIADLFEEDSEDHLAFLYDHEQSGFDSYTYEMFKHFEPNTFGVRSECVSFSKKAKSAAKKLGKITGKGLRALGKVPKKVTNEIGRFFKHARKGWEKTRKFIKKHKKVIIIGVLVVAVASVVIYFLPQISQYLAAIFPFLFPEKDDNQPKNANASPPPQNISEEQIAQEVIEFVQASLLENNSGELVCEDAGSNFNLENIRYKASIITHEFLDQCNEAYQFFGVVRDAIEAGKESFDSYCTTFQQNLVANLSPEILNKTESAYNFLGEKIASYLLDSPPPNEGDSEAFFAMWHQKIDSIFDTRFADCFTPENKEFREKYKLKKYEGYVPLPGSVASNLKSIESLLPRFTKNTYRKNLKVLKPLENYANHHAHHVFPQAYEDVFKKYGINIHDPKYLTWWEQTEHLSKKNEYNNIWQAFFRDNKNITKEQILEYGKKLMTKYGFEVSFE